MAADDLVFEAPGPGSWTLDPAHFSRPFSTWMLELYPEAFGEGFSAGTKRYGILVDYPEAKPVHGFLYVCIRIAGAPKKASPPPPKPLFKLINWLHPELRRRHAAIRETFETRRWRDDLQRWDSEIKPAVVASNEQLQAIDPTELSDEQLASHITRCRGQLRSAIVLHHQLSPAFILPLGDYIAQVTQWSDRDPAELLSVFRGASAVSVGALDEIEAAGAAIRAAEDARDVLVGSPPAEALTRLRSMEGEVGRRVRSWLDIVGYRIVSGYDVADEFALESPSTLVNGLRCAVEGRLRKAQVDDAGNRAAEIRASLPAEFRPRFDELYEEARLTYRLRDERAYFNDFWTLGLTRRALLEVGRRLTERDVVHAPDHVLDMGHEQLLDVLSGASTPPADELARRARHRTTLTNDDAPFQIGDPPAEPPPPEWLPRHAARGMRAVGAVISMMLEDAEVREPGEIVRGLGVSNGVCEGRARVVRSADDMDRLAPGDVLVAPMTTPTYNVVLPMISGIVTDRGGLLSHAAIVAREYDIPGVVGCRNAVDRIPDGATVVVDGKSGAVEVRS